MGHVGKRAIGMESGSVESKKRKETIKEGLEAVALRVEAIITRVEAIAIIRLEAIAVRLEAIALRVEAHAAHVFEGATLREAPSLVHSAGAELPPELEHLDQALGEGWCIDFPIQLLVKT